MKPWHIVLLIALILGAGGFAVYRLTRRGLDEIKSHEALRLQPYQDSAGHWTIGYGHKIQPGESYLMQPISETQAELLLKSDVAKAESAVTQLVKVPLSTGMFDALVSFVFNIGAGAFEKSTMLKKLNAGDYQGASSEFPRWSYAGGKQSAGLLARRAREQSLFLA